MYAYAICLNSFTTLTLFTKFNYAWKVHQFTEEVVLRFDGGHKLNVF